VKEEKEVELIGVDVKSNVFKAPECCDLCGEEKDNLFIKPNYLKVNGQLIISVQRTPLWVCLECFSCEFEMF